MADVAEELDGATVAGLPSQTVIGADRDVELLSWADELGITGQAAQLPRIVGSTFAATASAMTLWLIGTLADIRPGQVVISVYLLSALICVAGTASLIAWQLHQGSDRYVRTTVRNVLIALPFGGIGAAAVGWLTAQQLSYKFDATTIAAVLLVVVLVLAATATAARLAALRHAPAHSPVTKARLPA